MEQNASCLSRLYRSPSNSITVLCGWCALIKTDNGPLASEATKRVTLTQNVGAEGRCQASRFPGASQGNWAATATQGSLSRELSLAPPYSSQHSPAAPHPLLQASGQTTKEGISDSRQRDNPFTLTLESCSFSCVALFYLITSTHFEILETIEKTYIRK